MKVLADLLLATARAQALRLVGMGAICLLGWALSRAFGWAPSSLTLWVINALAVFMALFGLHLPRRLGWGRALMGLAMGSAFGYLAWAYLL